MKPKILVPGNDLNCVHNEYIGDNIGTCRKCGQVRDYSRCQNQDKLKKLFAGKARKGGRANVAVPIY